MYDDEFYDEEDEFSEAIDQDEVYRQHGKDERAFVDSQREEFERKKKQKRDELATIKLRQLSLLTSYSTKKRALDQLSVVEGREEYLDSREQVVSERAVMEHPGTVEELDLEQMKVQQFRDAKSRERTKAELEQELALMKTELDEIARKISLLEREILMS